MGWNCVAFANLHPLAFQVLCSTSSPPGWLNYEAGVSEVLRAEMGRIEYWRLRLLVSGGGSAVLAHCFQVFFEGLREVMSAASVRSGNEIQVRGFGR